MDQLDKLDKLAERLAELFKERVNPPSTSLRIGKVIGSSPLKIQWGDSVILSGDKLIVPRTFTAGHPIGDQTFKIDLSAGDEVIIAPETSEMRRWFVIDKI